MPDRLVGQRRMPTTPSHAFAGLAIGALLAPESVPWPYHAVTVALALLPDIDALCFPLGIPYGSRFGHRGFTHSLLFALLAGLLAAVLTSAALNVPWWRLWACFVPVTVSHTLLDAMTDGGLGVALFSPFDEGRYFFTFRPIRVSPIGLAVFSRWGLRALSSEILWVWAPLLLA